MNQDFYVDRGLFEEAMRVSGESDASAVLTKALQEYIRQHSPKRILELCGKLDWDPGYDYKPARSRNRSLSCRFRILSKRSMSLVRRG